MKVRPRIETLPKYESHRAQHDGDRFYSTPEGFMPSVTTVLRDDSRFKPWRKYVGEAEANRIMNEASARGTWTHDSAENFLLTGEEPEFHYVYQPWWKSIKPFLDVIDHTILTEGAVWNADNYAGAFDCLCYLKDGINNGGDNELIPDADSQQPVLVDFKTANKLIGGTKLYGYEKQCAAYAKALNYVYRKEGLIVRQALIACAVPGCAVQLFHINRDDINQLYTHFLEQLEDWHDKHTIPKTLKVTPDPNVSD